MATTLFSLVDDALALIFDTDSSDEGSMDAVREKRESTRVCRPFGRRERTIYEEYDKYLKTDDSMQKKVIRFNSEENDVLPFKPPRPTNPEEIPASITVKSLVPIEMKKRFMAEDYQYVRDNMSHLLQVEDHQETTASPKPKGRGSPKSRSDDRSTPRARVDERSPRDDESDANERDVGRIYRSVRVEDDERGPRSTNRGATSYSPERDHGQREVYEHSHSTRQRGALSNNSSSSKDNYYSRAPPKSRGRRSKYDHSSHSSRYSIGDEWSRKSAPKKTKGWLGLR
jgi:hypothetical protein